MVKNRLIFTLLSDNGNYMLSRNFSLQKVGDLNWLREHYNFDAIAYSIDELILLNVAREDKNFKQFSENIMELGKQCFIPIVAGGGIRKLEDAYLLMNSGADKLVVNSPVTTDPALVKALVNIFGSQCIVASIDYFVTQDKTEVYISNGSKATGMTVEQAIEKAQGLGCGEIYLTSMDNDGTGEGYDLETIKKASSFSKVPIIVSGGAGKYGHLAEGIVHGGVTASATANLFNFMADGLSEARDVMKQRGIEMASWEIILSKENGLIEKDKVY
ncbi:MAG: HisA/HisF-related TIM barrel protein [Candidatus Omnitrophica bacterium]|nr:HisA/HisF-related TIM barrel protein [Candidatus Omnitrophota bacterium]